MERIELTQAQRLMLTLIANATDPNVVMEFSVAADVSLSELVDQSQSGSLGLAADGRLVHLDFLMLVQRTAMARLAELSK